MFFYGLYGYKIANELSMPEKPDFSHLNLNDKQKHERQITYNGELVEYSTRYTGPIIVSASGLLFFSIACFSFKSPINNVKL